MKYAQSDTEKLSFWQTVFVQSKANGAHYKGEHLPGYKWDWPKDTYLQRRLRQIRWDLTSERYSF